jgi:uncharacterized membrane protein YphA (DoxX/SURF4 family)
MTRDGVLWVCQSLLALVFTFSGVVKATQPVPRIVAMGQTGVDGLRPALVHFIGVAELCGVLGLLLPGPLGIVPVLTPIAAACLGLIMVLAAPIHVRRREYWTAVGNLVLLAVCAAVAVGRWRQP